MKKILHITDAQKAFTQGINIGAVPDAQNGLNYIQYMINNFKFDKTIITFDTHTKEDYEVSEEKIWFPEIHCEFKTQGWELDGLILNTNETFENKIAKLNIPFEKIEIEDKVYYTKNKFDIWEGNQIFEKDIVNNFSNKEYEIVVVGFALNYCVFNAIKGYIKNGYKVTLVLNGTKAIVKNYDGTEDKTYKESLNWMEQNKVIIVENYEG